MQTQKELDIVTWTRDRQAISGSIPSADLVRKLLDVTGSQREFRRGDACTISFPNARASEVRRLVEYHE